jgi:hypothetical protein
MSMANWGNKREAPPLTSTDGAFTLLEVVMSVFLMVVALSVALPAIGQLIQSARLQGTAEQLLWNLREMQALAQVSCNSAMVRMSRYTPNYWTYTGVHQLQGYEFQPHIHYKDDYLQMETDRIGYNPAGGSVVAGTIRLAVGSQEMDIHLYMGSGLQTLEVFR